MEIYKRHGERKINSEFRKSFYSSNCIHAEVHNILFHFLNIAAEWALPLVMYLLECSLLLNLIYHFIAVVIEKIDKKSPHIIILSNKDALCQNRHVYCSKSAYNYRCKVIVHAYKLYLFYSVLEMFENL